MSAKTCALVGDMKFYDRKQIVLRDKLRALLAVALEEGYNHFISGFDTGAGIIFAELVVEFKKDYPDITLEAALPYRSRVDSQSKAFHDLLAQCNIVGVHGEKYLKHCCVARDYIAASFSQKIIYLRNKNRESVYQAEFEKSFADKEIEFLFL